MMKIGIEGQRLFRRKKHGMDMVALELIRNLQIIDSVNEYFIFVKPDEDTECLKETSNFHIIPVEGKSYPLWEQISLPKAAKKYGCNLLHCTSNTAPLQLDIPLIVTLHDIIYMEKSYWQLLNGNGTAYQKFGNAYRRYVVPRILKKSAKTITVSEYEQQRIESFFGLKHDKLIAIYNGVGEHFVRISDQETLTNIKNKYQLPDKYFFFLGNTDPKKNTPGVLQAFSSFKSKDTNNYKLVMLDYDESELQKLLNQIGATELRKEIHLTGYVVNTDLPAIYSLADIFLYPSLRESFGIPMLEGMKCGVPVITSNTSSMPEIADDAAYIIDPYKPHEITHAIEKILNDSVLRDNLIQKGFERSKSFSWNQMAFNVLKLYNSIH